MPTESRLAEGIVEVKEIEVKTDNNEIVPPGSDVFPRKYRKRHREPLALDKIECNKASEKEARMDIVASSKGETSQSMKTKADTKAGPSPHVHLSGMSTLVDCWKGKLSVIMDIAQKV